MARTTQEQDSTKAKGAEPDADDTAVEGAEPTAEAKAVDESGTTAEGLDADALAKASGKQRHVDVRSARLTSADPDAEPTRLNEDVSMPGYVAPGDGPFDTVDPSEHATSVTPDKGAAAAKGFGVVNAVQPIADPSGREQVLARAAQESGSEGRMETYTVTGPDGKPVKIERNMDTGESKRV